MKKKYCVFIVLLSLGAYVFSQSAPQKPSVQVIRVKETTEYDTAFYGARVEPVNSLTLLVPFGGTIRKIFVSEGDFVSRETPLYAITRTTQGAAGDYVPLTVRSLTEGIVSDVSIDPGEEVRDGTATMTIADISTLKSVLSVSDKDVSGMYKGMNCTVKGLDNVSGSINKISVLPDAKSGLFSVEVIFNPSALIFPGKFVTIQVPVNPVKGTFIPSIAIVSRYSKKFVWVINEDNRATMEEITLVNMKGDVSLVIGLKSGQNIAVSNTRFLIPDTEVKIIQLESMTQIRGMR